MESIQQLRSSLEHVSLAELIHLCRKFSIPFSNTTKTVIISRICERYFNVKKYIRYTYIQQLGREGKDGRTFLALDENRRHVAVKIFSKTKSARSIVREAQLQTKAAQRGISPRVYEYDGDGKYIVMEKLDVNLFDCFRLQQGSLTRDQQKAVIRLFRELDRCKVFHGDPNPLNFMQKKDQWYVIDFGFAQPIDDKTIPKYGDTPNMKYMPLGFKLKLTNIYKECTLPYIEKYC